jgi:hypothetical protein
MIGTGVIEPDPHGVVITITGTQVTPPTAQLSIGAKFPCTN